MRNGKLAAAKLVLSKAQAMVSDEVIMALIAAVERAEETIFEKGDFVMISGGMGNYEFATVKRRKGKGYVVEGFDYNGLWPSMKREYSTYGGEPMQLSSPEEAMNDFHDRGGISEDESNAMTEESLRNK